MSIPWKSRSPLAEGPKTSWPAGVTSIRPNILGAQCLDCLISSKHGSYPTQQIKPNSNYNNFIQLEFLQMTLTSNVGKSVFRRYILQAAA